MKRIVLSLSALFIAIASSFAQTVTSTSTATKLQGVVHDDSGKVVTGAYATATLQSPTDHSVFTSVTGAAGDYAFSNLPTGKYSICVQVLGGPHLNPCIWSTATQVSVAAGQTVLTPTITVTKGALLQIRLSDPGQLIGAKDDLLIGFYLPSGLFQPLRLASTDALGRTYDAAVPLNSSVRLGVVSTHLTVSDSKGSALSAALPTLPGAPAITAATSATISLAGLAFDGLPPVTLTVSGRK